MTLVFLSNFMNHHQMPISKCFYNILGEGYHFITTSEMKDEQKRLGYQDLTAPFILNYGDDKKACQELIDSADAVIFGSAPVWLLHNRLKNKKLIFNYSERLFKEKSLFRHLLRAIKWDLVYIRRKNVYLLCASAFSAGDFAKIGLFRDKAFKWGYFPEVKKLDIEKVIESKKKHSILWVARLIELKHPEYAIETARYLKEKGISFEMNFIGIGPLEEKMRNMIKEYELEEDVHLLGSMPPERVREHMERSEIFLFTSDQNEGWGAVLNESMSSGCAVVASNVIGAAPFLIKDGKNGLVFKSGDVKELCEKTEYLLRDDQERKELSKRAYDTMINEWSPDIAAERLLELYNGITHNSIPDFSDGPGSRA